ncbi:hypothetical protein [Caudoviricetes sp.]|nr:hypothetical protein [Caudoviricetes sp.]
MERVESRAEKQETCEQLILFDVAKYIVAATVEIDYDEALNYYSELADPRGIAREGEW